MLVGIFVVSFFISACFEDKSKDGLVDNARQTSPFWDSHFGFGVRFSAMVITHPLAMAIGL
jgi:hypothetical protein